MGSMNKTILLLVASLLTAPAATATTVEFLSCTLSTEEGECSMNGLPPLPVVNREYDCPKADVSINTHNEVPVRVNPQTECIH